MLLPGSGKGLPHPRRTCRFLLFLLPLLLLRPEAQAFSGAGGASTARRRSGGALTGTSTPLAATAGGRQLEQDLVGDWKRPDFDPLGLCTSEELLEKYSDAELKHGRLAMMATGGWVVAEVVYGIAKRVVPVSSVCTGNGCAMDGSSVLPALPLELIGRFSIAYFCSALLVASLAEIRLGKRRSLGEEEWIGNLGVDPFGLASGERTQALRIAEVSGGRLAMMAFLARYVQVLLKSKGVVFAHQLWGEVCVVNLRADMGMPAPICYPRPEEALDGTLSWEILYRVVSSYWGEPYF
jgi:hypothetical protein